MATYITSGDERLYNLSSEFYRRIDDDAMMGIVRANIDDWDGNGVFDPRITLFIPDEAQVYEYETDIPAYYRNLKDAFDGQTSIPVPVSVGLTVNTSPIDGGSIDEIEAIKYAMQDALLSYRPERWMRPEYGTKLIDSVKYPANDELASEFKALAAVVLAKYRERFEVIQIIGNIIQEMDSEGRTISYLQGEVVAVRPIDPNPIVFSVRISLL